MNTLQERLGSVVREVRVQFGWSQERLAETSGLDRSYVGEIERGQVSPTLATLEKLSAALELTPSELLGRSENCNRREEESGFLDRSQPAGDVP